MALLAKMKALLPTKKEDADEERPRRMSEADEAAVDAAVARDRLESCLVEPDEPKQQSDADWRVQVAAKASSNIKVAKVAVGKAAAVVAAKFAEMSAASAAAEAEARARAASTAFVEGDGPRQMSDAEWRASVRNTTAASAKSAATAVKSAIAETSAAHAAAEKAARSRKTSTEFAEGDEVPQPSDAAWRASVRNTMVASSGTAKAVMMASANAVTTAMAKAAAAVAQALADEVLPSGPGPSVQVKFEVDDDGFVGVKFGVVDAPPAPRVR